LIGSSLIDLLENCTLYVIQAPGLMGVRTRNLFWLTEEHRERQQPFVPMICAQMTRLSSFVCSFAVEQLKAGLRNTFSQAF